MNAIDKARALFNGGDTYAAASNVLNTNGNANLLIPSHVTAALSLELYFKSLYVLETGKDFMPNGRHSHDFLKLFDALNPSTQSQLISLFNAKNVAISHKSAIIEFEKQIPGLKISTALRDNLTQWSVIFIDFRYVHEFIDKNPTTKSYALFYPEIMEILREVILRLHPTWTT